MLFRSIWDAMSGTPIGEPLKGHSGSVWSVAFSPDGTRIVSGSSDKTVRIWDAMSGTPIGEPLKGHSEWVWSVAFSPDGTRIVSGSGDKTVRIWDATAIPPTCEPLKAPSGLVKSAVSSPDHTHIIPAPTKKAIPIFPAAVEVLDSATQPWHHPSILSHINTSHNANVPNGVPVFAGSFSLHDDGWVATAEGLLLFWLPPEHHLGFFSPGTLAVLGAHSIPLNMEKFVHGPDWMQCHAMDC